MLYVCMYSIIMRNEKWYCWELFKTKSNFFKYICRKTWSVMFNTSFKIYYKIFFHVEKKGKLLLVLNIMKHNGDHRKYFFKYFWLIILHIECIVFNTCVYKFIFVFVYTAWSWSFMTGSFKFWTFSRIFKNKPVGFFWKFPIIKIILGLFFINVYLISRTIK